MYSAKEAARRAGLTTSALRYYEEAGLLPPVARTQRGSRQYTDADLEWVAMIQCLRRAGVPIRSIRSYVALSSQGSGALAERIQLVRGYVEALQEKKEAVDAALKLAEDKLDFLEGLSASGQDPDLTVLEEWELFAAGRG